MGCISSIPHDTANYDTTQTADISQSEIDDYNTLAVPCKQSTLNNNVLPFEEQYQTGKQIKYKLLILGAAESGKSTLLKQLRILYGRKYDKSELLAAKPRITQNTIEAMRSVAIYSRILARQGKHIYFSSSPRIANNINLVSGYIRECDLNIPQCIEKILHGFLAIFIESFASIRDRIARMSDTQKFSRANYVDFATLWHSKQIEKILEYKHKFQLINSYKYLFSNMHKYWRDEYIPTFQDLIHSYQPITESGVNKIEFVIPNDDEYEGDEEIYEIYDVRGGYIKNKKIKWMDFLDNTAVVIFVVALSGYNERLWRTEKLRESIGLFQCVVNSDIFKNTHFIVFLNKCDLLEHECKVDIVNLFKQIFKKQRRDKKEIHFHVGSATDTLCIEKMFESLRYSIY